MGDLKATGRESDKFMLRLPDGMRERIATAASAAGRSMNAEIVARLAGSFDPNAGQPRRESLYVLLDADGRPVSWAEIREVLQAIRAEGGFDPDEMEVVVCTPDMEASSRRTKQAKQLAEQLRPGGRSRLVTPEDRASQAPLSRKRAES